MLNALIYEFFILSIMLIFLRIPCLWLVRNRYSASSMLFCIGLAFLATKICLSFSVNNLVINFLKVAFIVITISIIIFSSMLIKHKYSSEISVIEYEVERDQIHLSIGGPLTTGGYMLIDGYKYDLGMFVPSKCKMNVYFKENSNSKKRKIISYGYWGSITSFLENLVLLLFLITSPVIMIFFPLFASGQIMYSGIGLLKKFIQKYAVKLKHRIFLFFLSLLQFFSFFMLIYNIIYVFII